jgi:hypothetical protein
MFAVTFVLEREPLSWTQLPAAIQAWVQNAGGVAALALAIYCLAYAIQRPAYARKEWSGSASLFVGAAALAAICYAILILLVLGRALGIYSAASSTEGFALTPLQDFFLTAGGALAIAAVTLPILIALVTRIRGGRIWALARLSLKEAVRSRVILVFGAIAVVFLFAHWFVPYKAEDQVRNYVRVVYWSLAPLFLLIASLLGAFSIPTDVKSQTIHTVVTKPVERFEIVLGRFLGYGILITLGLGVLTAASLVYVARGVTPEAAQESYKARVPVYADQPLVFIGTKGDNVGRIWDYRRYISAPSLAQPDMPLQYAVWSFDYLPASLRAGDPVRVEFTFDIFRLTKGEEARGVYTSFVFADGRLSLAKMKEQLAALKGEQTDLRKKIDDARLPKEERDRELKKIDEDLLTKYALYEVGGMEVTDYHTQVLGGENEETRREVAANVGRLLKKLGQLEESAPRPADGSVPALRVFVSVDRARQTQMLGVAPRDFYLLAAERPFLLNFVKGIVGMWCSLLMVLGIAVAASTYLSGVISWLCTLFLYGAGMFTEYARQIAENRAPGGGPIESAHRLFSRLPQGVPLEQGATTSLLQGLDDVYRWWLRRFIDLVPDVNRYDLHQYVANGFDISWGRVLLLDNMVPLVGYLVPCAVLAYYLMKFREVANPT